MPSMFNSSRYYLERFANEASASGPRGMRILDAGAGACPYRPNFEANGHIYESADFGAVDKEYGHLTYRCRLDSIPVEAERFDLVFLTQVLEHLPEPLAVLQEMNRVLKPNGVLWASAPLYYEEHEKPYDFFRYTQFGLQHLLTAAKFDVDRLEWLDGYAGAVAHQYSRAAKFLPLHPRAYGGGLKGVATAAVVALHRPILALMARVLAAADGRSKYTAKGHPINYAVVARKRCEASLTGQTPMRTAS